MARRLTRNLRVTKVRYLGQDHPEADTRADTLAVEEPLQIRVDGEDFSTTMRTPGHDFELVHGLLHAEGVITTREDLSTLRYCAGATGPGGSNTYNTVDVALSRPAAGRLPVRALTTTSACGVCGTTSIDDVTRTARYPLAPVAPTPDFVVSLPEKLKEGQRAFRRTGGIHAAAAVTAHGEVVAVREDVGRHNAADKVIGWMLMEDLVPATGMYLAMSSRASFELVQKAVLAGFSGLVAVSAATSLAVETAREAGLFLAGFTRPDRFNLYSGVLS
ncbi:formate dehydrogenase accessory sulfurtransferase FdhD [Corynebacterium liangguodongii]|uniref:Sulfur carrier protein FdhD n=1 Tax=Corynebacterium liangguodongii TaxID=2079535 RepID=A0A2S0WDR9_9CORY|nr:formate dehydrogenase accessory sulfurtransferase FdhD [Corynebacterium liangguodongii]AWB83925.1 formate dehydrogenase accessory sulfurtransferase FdhD [Corynebacterium liangguodongii]PWB99064.1 formate dehydrogenase accessory sulfurtransferase FdhD [Corynebacterium liangguodongii]